MRILIDGDGCPVVDITVQIAKSKGIPCMIFCDTSHRLERAGVQTVCVDQGADSVDFKLVSVLQPNDIVVTQDYGLAAMCLSKGARAIHQNGMIYSGDTMDGLLFGRFLAKKVRASGGRLKGPPKRTARQDKAFAAALRGLLEEL